MSASRPYSVGSGMTRNTFNMGFRNLTSMDFGRIQPVVVQEAVPNDDINLNMAECVATLAPTAAPLQGKFIMHAAAFFVPNRVVWKEFNKYIIGQSNAAIPSVDINSFVSQCIQDVNDGYQYRDRIAYLTSFGLNPYKHYQNEKMSILCLRAYRRIWWDWFRDANVIPDSNESSYLWDGAVSANELTQLANRGLYYSTWYHQFVTSTLKTPNGDSRGLAIGSNSYIDNQGSPISTAPSSGGYALPVSSSFSQSEMDSRINVYQPSTSPSVSSVNSLRAANALQAWLEKCNILGYRLRDRLRGMFGSSVSAETLQMSEYLGQTEFLINNDSQTSNQSTGQSGSTDFTVFGTTNPAQSSMAGQLHGKTSMTTNGLGGIKYHAKEHGYFIVVAWCLPDVMLTDGIPAHLTRGVSGPAPSRFDFLTPEMVNIGFEPLYYKEFMLLPQGAKAEGETGTFNPNNVLGWRGRYENYKYNRDYLGGCFVDKNSALSMKPWVLNRDYFDEQNVSLLPDGSYTPIAGVPLGTKMMNNVNHDTISQTWGAMFLGDSKFMITNSSLDHIVTQWKIDLQITRPLPAVVAPRIELVSAQPVMNGGTHL